MYAKENSLENLWAKHNRDSRSFAHRMRSMSVSDIVVLTQGGKKTAYYADTINASASIKLQTVFFFMVCYAPFLKYLWLCINLVCSIPEAALKFPHESAGKVSQKCHSSCVIQ